MTQKPVLRSSYEVCQNREIFLVQLAARPFPKHNRRSLRTFINSTLTRNKIGSLKTMYLYFLHPKLDKPILLYKLRYFSIQNLTSSIQNHTQIPYTHISIQIFIVPYSNFIVPYNPRHVSIPMIFFFFFFLSLIFSLIRFCSSLSKTKMRYLFWSYPYLILSPFYFTFQLKEETSSLFPSSHLSLPQFSSLFDFCNIFLLLLFGP